MASTDSVHIVAVERNSAIQDDSIAAAAARRAKKREQDRHCQRRARERTKSRITQLEEMVASFKEKDSTEQIQTVWKQRDEIAAERDALAETLRIIVKTIQSSKHTLPILSVVATLPIKSNAASPLLQQQAESRGIQNPQLNPERGSQPATLSPNVLNINTDEQALSEAWLTNPISTPTPIGIPDLDFTSTDMAWSDEDSDLFNNCPDAIFPLPVNSCECSPGPTIPPPHNGEKINLWRFANETLVEPTQCSALVSRMEDEIEDDTPIRAMIEGWPAVEKRLGGSLPSSWQKLRKIDETLFSTCADTERLAILRVMHTLMRYHQDPTSERRATLPQWYLARYGYHTLTCPQEPPVDLLYRPSQEIAHSYAIDYFAWYDSIRMLI
jgi:hypothetical protein